MKKFFIILLTALVLLFSLVSCDTGKQNETESETVKAIDPKEVCGFYCRMNDNGYDSFSITLYEDGTYTYYETMISSYIGHGTYTLDKNLITLTDNQIPTLSGTSQHTFKFEYRGGKLFFLATESDQFMYVDLPDGAEFERVEDEKTKEE